MALRRVAIARANTSRSSFGVRWLVRRKQQLDAVGPRGDFCEEDCAICKLHRLKGSSHLDEHRRLLQR